MKITFLCEVSLRALSDECLKCYKENCKGSFYWPCKSLMYIFPLMQMSMNVHLIDITVMPTRNVSTLQDHSGATVIIRLTTMETERTVILSVSPWTTDNLFIMVSLKIRVIVTLYEAKMSVEKYARVTQRRSKHVNQVPSSSLDVTRSFIKSSFAFLSTRRTRWLENHRWKHQTNVPITFLATFPLAESG